MMDYKIYEVIANQDNEKIWFELIPVENFKLTKVDIDAIEMALKIEDYTFLPGENGTYLVTKKDHIDPDEIDPSGCILRHKQGGFMVIN